MGDTAGPLGAGGDHAEPSVRAEWKPPLALPIVVFDSKQILRFLRSVSIAKVQEQKIRIQWEEYTESEVLNVIYWLMPWKGKPGTAIVETGNPYEIERLANEDSSRLMKDFVSKAAQGPEAAKRWLEAQQRIKESCLEGVREAFSEAAKINAAVRKETAEGVKTLATIKAGADLLMTGLGFFTGVGGMGLNLVYSFANGLIKEWDQVGTAKVVAFSKDIAPETGKAAAENIEHTVEKKILEGERFSERAKELGKLAKKYQRELAARAGRGGSKTSKLVTRIRLRGAEMQAARKAAGRAAASGVARRLLGRLTYVFAAYQVYHDLQEFHEVVEEAEKEIGEETE